MPAITPDLRLASPAEAANPLAWLTCIDFVTVCVPVIVLGNNGLFGDLSLLFHLAAARSNIWSAREPTIYTVNTYSPLFESLG
jgi:hypothetical protein